MAAGAAGDRGRVSATASRKARSSGSGAGSRVGPSASGTSSGGLPPGAGLQSGGTQCASGGMAAASSRTSSRSAVSSGPSRQASYPAGLSPGSSSPRAAKRRASRAAAPQKGTAPAGAAARARVSSGSASARGTTRAVTVVRRRSGVTMVSRSAVLVVVPGPSRRRPPSGSPSSRSPAPASPEPPAAASGRTEPVCQKAIRPSRAGSAGRKTAEQWMRPEIVERTHSSSLTTEYGVTESNPRPAPAVRGGSVTRVKATAVREAGNAGAGARVVVGSGRRRKRCRTCPRAERSRLPE